MLRRPHNVWLLALFTLGFMAASAFAQPPQGGPGRRPGGPGFGGPGFGGPGGPGGANDAMLLSVPQVQKELELLPEQVTDLAKLRETQQASMRESFGSFRDLSEDERRKKFEELRPKMEAAQKEMRDKVNEILLPHQQDRLKEISLQVRGVAAIEDPAVATELGISEEQRAEIRKIREGQREKVTAMFREGQGGEGNREAMREKFQTLRTENDKQLLAVLTTKQREQFEKMKGEKFELDMAQLGRGPGGPGGPGGARFGGRRPGGDRPEGGPRPEGDRPRRERPTREPAPTSNEDK